MAPLYPLEDNINKTEECRKNINSALTLLPILTGSTMLRQKLNLPLTDDGLILKNKKIDINTPLIDTVNYLETLIKSFKDFSKYPCYLYYTYCGYAVQYNIVEPILGYTSNSEFLNRLDGDKWFYRYINITKDGTYDLPAHNTEGDYGRTRYPYFQDGSAQRPTIGNTYFYRTDPKATANLVNVFTTESFIPQGTIFAKTNVNSDYKRSDWVRRFPWYPNSLLYDKNLSYGQIYSSEALPVKSLCTAKNTPSDINDIIEKLYEAGDTLKNNGNWDNNYFAGDQSPTDIIVTTLPTTLGTFNYGNKYKYNGIQNLSFGYKDAVATGNGVLDSNSVNSTTVFAPESGSGGSLYTIIAKNTDKWGDSNNGYPPKYEYKLKINKSISDDDFLMFTPLARRQPVLIIDDMGIFEKEYSYALNSTNRATNTNIATKLNNVAPLDIFRKYISNNNPKTTGEATQKSEIITLKPGKYQFTVIGGAGTGIYGFFNLNRNYFFYDLYRGRNGSVCKCNIECKKDIKFKLITGSQGLWNTNALPQIGVYNQYIYSGNQNDGADSKIQIINEDGTTTDFIICEGGRAAKFNNGVSVNTSNVNINESIPNITVLEKIILYKDETSDIQNTHKIVSPDSVLYNSTPLYTYIPFNNTYGWAGIMSNNTSYRENPTGGYISIEQYY